MYKKLCKLPECDNEFETKRNIQKYCCKDHKRLHYHRTRYHDNPKVKKQLLEAHRKRKFGIENGTYDKMFAEQNGVCYICKRTATEVVKSRSVLSIDHCHKTGKVRKLLCNSCNTALGHVGDNINTLEKMISYLKNN